MALTLYQINEALGQYYKNFIKQQEQDAQQLQQDLFEYWFKPPKSYSFDVETISPEQFTIPFSYVVNPDPDPIVDTEE